MPSPFREEHEQFRKTVRQFAEKELAPYVDEWERAEIFPNEVFKRAGELGILGAHYPEAVGGAGSDFWFSVVKSEELPRCRSAGVTMGDVVRWIDDVELHEPLLALDGGPGGTRVLEQAVWAGAELLRPGGALLLELGGDQAEALGGVLTTAGFAPARLFEDDDGDVRGIETK